VFKISNVDSTLWAEDTRKSPLAFKAEVSSSFTSFCPSTINSLVVAFVMLNTPVFIFG
jgi:hypothetical protein